MSELHDRVHSLLSQFGTRGYHAADAVIHHIIGPLEHDRDEWREKAQAAEAELERCRDELHYRTKSEESICGEVARLREALAKAEAEIADLQQDRDKWREAKLVVEVERDEARGAAALNRAVLKQHKERAVSAEALLAEACEILESYVLLGSRKAKDFLVKVKQRDSHE